MRAKDKAELLGDLDKLLMIVDSLIGGRSNMIFKTDLNELRNRIVETQEKYA